MQLFLLRKLHVLASALCFLCLIFSATVHAKNVYESQPPMTDKELVSFIQTLPQFRTWAIAQKEQAHPQMVGGKPDFVYSDAAKNWVQAKGWEPRRFFSVMGKAAAALYIVSEGSRQNDMPEVSQAELDLVQKYLTQLLEAGKSSAPMKQ